MFKQKIDINMEQQVVLFDKYEIEKRLKREAMAANYQAILDAVGSIRFTRENVAEDLLAPARKVLDDLKKTKDEIKRPHLDANTEAERVYKELSQPLQQLVDDKIREKTKIANQIEAERQQIEAEKRRIEGITDYIKHFFTESVNYLLRQNVTSQDIVKLEMRIGNELSRKSYYGDLYPIFVAKTDEIRKIIAERKEFVRRAEKLDKELAKNSDNQEKVAEILEEKEDISIFLLQNKTELQEEATSVSPQDLGIHVGESTAMPVIAARRQWTYEVTDIGELYRKHPELVKIEPDAAAIRAFSTKIRSQSENIGKNEINLPGIRFYQEKKYK